MILSPMISTALLTKALVNSRARAYVYKEYDDVAGHLVTAVMFAYVLALMTTPIILAVSFFRVAAPQPSWAADGVTLLPKGK